MFRWAQWLCRFTFREKEYQQALELECRDMHPCLQLRPLFQVVNLPTLQLSLPHCRLNDGCPVAPLRDAVVDAQLGVITVRKIDANRGNPLMRKYCSKTTCHLCNAGEAIF